MECPSCKSKDEVVFIHNYTEAGETKAVCDRCGYEWFVTKKELSEYLRY